MAPPLLTGYEQIVPHRVDDLFAYTAKADGVVVKRDKDHILVSYPGTELADVAIQLGTRYGVSRGSSIPHQVRSDLRTGSTFRVGDAIAYNLGFFGPDPLNPGRVLWKNGALARTALMESADTTDDSSAISEELGERLSLRTSKVRTLMLTFNQAVRNLVEPGDVVTTDSILCHIEDPLTVTYDLFEDSSIDTLRLVSANTPRAKYAGTIDRIEVVYNGSVDDISPALRALAEDSDARSATLSRKLKGAVAPSGQISGYGRIDGTTLEPNTIAVQIYILGDLGAGAGDKAVFANQLKTVVCRVLSGVNQTESGAAIDAVFGYTSIDNRIVVSPTKIGTTNTLAIVLGHRAASVYRGGKIEYRGKHYGDK